MNRKHPVQSSDRAKQHTPRWFKRLHTTGKAQTIKQTRKMWSLQRRRADAKKRLQGMK